MSRNEWEEGSIKLPSAEFARVRQAVADRVTKDSDAVYAKSQEFWSGLTAKQKRDPQAYFEALDEFRKKNSRPTYSYGRGDSRESTLPHGFDDAVQAHSRWSRNFTPRRVQKTHLSYPTKKDLKFSSECAFIGFDRDTNTVTWQVSENNHAVDNAHAQPIAEAFFGALSTVKWTRGTGGVLIGNDEYNEEAGREYAGGGGSYVTTGFGPVGAVEAPYRTAPYTMADGTKVTEKDFEKVAKNAAAAQRRQMNARLAAAGVQGRVGRGVPTGGQFTGRYRSESSIRL